MARLAGEAPLAPPTFKISSAMSADTYISLPPENPSLKCHYSVTTRSDSQANLNCSVAQSQRYSCPFNDAARQNYPTKLLLFRCKLICIAERTLLAHLLFASIVRHGSAVCGWQPNTFRSNLSAYVDAIQTLLSICAS